MPLLRRNGNFARRLSEGEQRLNLSFLRLLRLGRLTRMVRVLRAVPELVTMVKGYVFSNLLCILWQTLRGLYSAVSTPNFESKYSFE